MDKYYLGVDGGNTKTDYLLCTTEGIFVDVYRTDTCSHENFDDGYDGMERAMRGQLSQLFERNGITIHDIASAGLGLAGADLPGQVAELKKRADAIGFSCYGLSNDGILGIKATARNGVGICAVNGTGTVVVGIDEKGCILQIGGVGPVSGDNAGGPYIFSQILSRLYAYYYRCGADSAMFSPIMELVGARPEELLSIAGDYRRLRPHMVDIIQLGAQAAMNGDAVAKSVFDGVGISIGQGAAGCINHLSFKGSGTAEAPIDMVLVGSLWHKVPYTGMKDVFLQTVQRLSGKQCRCVALDAPAAVGGVLWAKEIDTGELVADDYRSNLLQSITMEKYDAWIGKGK